MQNQFGITDKSFFLILDVLKTEKNIDEVIIFGSRAMGNYKNGSDIDIAIKAHDFDRKSLIRLYWKLNEELPIPYFVDIIDYNKIDNKALKKHIDEKGKILLK